MICRQHLILPLPLLASLLYSSSIFTAADRPKRRQPFPTRGGMHLHPIIDDDMEPNSFARRNGLPTPPLISRNMRKRQLQANQTGSQTNETELDAIIVEAKEGEDPNAKLRDDLVWSAYYDRNSYPWEYAWYGEPDGNRTGVPVEMKVNFHRVYTVDVVNPVLDLIVWFELTWIDPRLTWDPEEYENHTKTWFWIDGGNGAGEMSEIWTPDIELWNLDQGLADSLEDAYAVVKYDGSVFWSRPGHLRPACKYTGLEKFPFDELSCTIELGSWSYSGKYLILEKGGDDKRGFSIGGSKTAGESYNEFTFVKNEPITSEIYTYPPFGGNSPDTGWPVMFYNVTLERSWQPYARGYIYGQVLISIIGFSAFWLPPSCGERMGLSITAMLASIASDIIIAENLPQAKELTWFQKFSLMGSTFSFLALIESVVVIYLFYSKSEDMVPKWYTYIKNWRVLDKVQKRSSDMVSEANDSIHRTAVKARETVFGQSTPINEDTNGERGGSSIEAGENGIVCDDQNMSRRSQFSRSETLMRDANDFQNVHEIENNTKWKAYAARIDDVSRTIFPLTYSIVLAIILAQAL